MAARAAGRSENRLDLLYFTYFGLLLEKISGLYIIGLCQIVSTVLPEFPLIRPLFTAKDINRF